MSEGRRGPIQHPLVGVALLAALLLAALIGGRTAPTVAGVGAASVDFAYATTLAGAAHRDPAVRPRPAAYPNRGARERAWRYARQRAGLVSFALIDSRGQAFGWQEKRRYVAASIVKAPLMVAELRRQRAKEGSAALDARTAGLLRAMVSHSDNSSADVLYLRGGDPALYDVARRTGMNRFSVQGHWGNAQVTAADLAAFMSGYEDAVPRRHRNLAGELLAGVVPDQRWGIPAVAEPTWNVELKGGWRPTTLGELVHQAARLQRGRTQLALAVLTDAQPSQAYGRETVEGIAGRLLGRPVNRRRSDSAWRSGS